jgi:hemerythrin-like domain-containing protein
MKRHTSLIPLSHEHHENLILAQLLKSNVRDYKGMPSTPSEKAAYALSCFEEGIRDHFQTEEKILDYLSHYTELKPLAAEILAEHEDLTSQFQLLNAPEVSVETLNTLGHALYNHIRKEDRVLFPLIESLCTEKEFEYILTLHNHSE